MLVLLLAAAFGTAMAATTARFVSVSGRAARAAALVAFTAMIVACAFVAFGSRLRINFTPSMPLGIYRLESLPTNGVGRGMVVEVCAPDKAAALGRRRGYLAAGPCPHDTEPLLKIVAGVPGDNVAVSAEGVAVNGCLLPDSRPIVRDRAGRLILPWPWGEYRLGRGQIWLYAGNPRSWDSRYLCPGSGRDVMARAAPLLIDPSVRSTSGPACAAVPSAGPGILVRSGTLLRLICVVFL